MIYLSARLQGPEGHLVRARREGPEGGRQIIQSVSQPTVDVDVETRGAVLEAAGMQHDMVHAPIRQSCVVETGGGEPAVGLLVTQSHFRRREGTGKVTNKDESITNTTTCVAMTSHTFAQFGLHAELQVLAVLSGVDHTEQ